VVSGQCDIVSDYPNPQPLVPSPFLLMDLFDAIANRHSYRGEFTDAPVSREDLTKIVQAGIQAPSACNEQIATFVVVDDPKLLAQIAEILGNKPYCSTAKAMIVCVADPRPVYAKYSFAAEDCAAAVENMLLAVTALGYATVWLDGALRTDNRAARIGTLLGVPQGRTIRILLPLGVPAGLLQPREKLPFDRRAWFNRHG
jgi:nitroreductase